MDISLRGKYNRIIQVVLAGLAFLCVAVLSIACTGGVGTDNDLKDGPQKSSLEAAITEAEKLLSSVAISDDGAGLDIGDKYTSQAVHDAFAAEIAAAKVVYDNAEATQEEIDAAKSSLESAKGVFESKVVTVEGNGEENGAALVQFNAPDARYDGTGIVENFGTGERWLIFPTKVDILNDSISIQARIKFSATTGHNGTGFISIEGPNRKGYMLLTAQNIKNVGTTGGAGGNGLSVTWTAGKEYVFKSEIAGGKIGHYVYDSDGTTLLASRNQDNVTIGHAVSDTVYAAVGGTGVNNMEWSEIVVTRNGTSYVIDSLLPQTALPSLAVSDTTVRLSLNTQGSVSYTATASGGVSAEVTAVSDDPSTVRVDSATGGTISFTALKVGNAVITVTNTADTSLTAKITVTVTDFPASDDYGPLTTVYPAAGAVSAYTDGELAITFDNAPKPETGGSVSIFDKTSGELVDTILFADEKQVTLGSSNNIINVGSQLARIDGNTLYITPHFDKLEYGKSYYIAIPQGAVTAALNGKTFAGLSSDKTIASWNFTTRAAPALTETTPVTVDGSQSSTAHFRTVYGALKAVAAKGGNWTINVAPGIYTELVHYNASSNITINGTGTAPFGKDVVIQYANGNALNGGTHTRPSFYFTGASLVLKNVTLKNTSSREKSDPGQAEALYFANGNASNGRTMAAYNCSFLSHQDTIQTTGKNWFYKCYIEGDTDYIWGTADVCLLEECELVSINDPFKTNSKEAILLVARTGSTADTAATVAKGYVLFNSKVTTQNGMTTYFGRNPGAGAYYDQCAVINTVFTNEGSGMIGAAIWKGPPYTFLAGAKEHVGWKVYGNTVGGAAQNTTGMLADTTVMTPELYSAEYANRELILNRVYKKAGGYDAAASIWNISSLVSDFNK